MVEVSGSAQILLKELDTTQLVSNTFGNFNSQSREWSGTVTIEISRAQLRKPRYNNNFTVFLIGVPAHELGHALGLGHTTTGDISSAAQCGGLEASVMHGRVSATAYCNWYSPQVADLTAINKIYK